MDDFLISISGRFENVRVAFLCFVAKIQSYNASHRGIKFTHSRYKLFTPLTVGVIAKVYNLRYPRWLGECNPVTRGQAENSNGRICSIRFA